MKLSIIVPVYNEEKTIKKILEKVLDLKIPNVEKEIIVVNDGSTDGTNLELRSKNKEQIRVITHDKNQGKGAAVKTGIQNTTGDYIVIQDADLEYNPQDIIKLLAPIFKNEATIVYGTRLKRWPDFSKDERTFRFFLHYLGNKFLSLLTSFLYGQWITDMETCYKIFPRKVSLDLNLKARGFEFEPEITAKLLKKGLKIYEVPITTVPRGYEEGKKLNTIRDGLIAFWTLLKYRFVD